VKKYLLDTNICAYFLNGKFDLEAKIDKAGFENCCISEITIAELKYGVAKSSSSGKKQKDTGNIPIKIRHSSDFSCT
jgi:tRNA(fMet)-specific endonuclease VapC